MARFYGFSDEAMESMVTDTFQDYWLACISIESSELLDQIIASSFHSLNKKNREQIQKSLNKKAQSILETENNEQLSLEEMAKKLARNMSSG